MTGSFLDALFGMWIVIAGLVWAVASILLAVRWVKEKLARLQDSPERKQTIDQIQEGAFYLRESGKNSTRGR